jgi:hypothetical protein
MFQQLVLLQDQNQITKRFPIKFNQKKNEKKFTSPASICVAISFPVDCGMNNGEGGRSRNASVCTSTSASSIRSLNFY